MNNIVLTEDQTNAIKHYLKSGQCRILFSTQTGTSAELAQQFQHQLEKNNINCQLLNLANQSSFEFMTKSGVNFIITSTYFQGMFPSQVQQNMKNFMEEQHEFNQNCYYVVLGIGSSRFKYFNRAGIMLDEYLNKIAVCFNKIILIDQGGSVPRTQQLKQQLLQVQDLIGFEIDWEQSQVKIQSSQIKYPAYNTIDKYIKFTLIQRQQLSFNVVDGIQSIYTFKADQEINFLPGSIVTILPRNQTEDVYRLLNNSKIYLDEQNKTPLQPEDLIQFKQITKSFYLPDGLYSLIDIIYQTIDLSRPITYQILQQLKSYFSQQHQKFFDSQFTNQKEMVQCRLFDRIHLSQLFENYPSLNISLEKLLNILTGIKPRQYSIANSPIISKNQNSTTIQLLITDVIWSNNQNQTVYGLSTGFLKECSECKQNQMQYYHMNRNRIIYISVLPGLVSLQLNSENPLLCIGLGSGMAPFRSYIQLRSNKQIKNSIVLFLGIRRKSDYNELLQELVYYVQTNICKVYIALSRESYQLYENPVFEPLTFYYESHIQHCLKQQQEVINQYMTNPDSYVLYCGKSGSVVEEVKQVLKESVQGMNKEEQDNLWNQKFNKGQISFEAW